MSAITAATLLAILLPMGGVMGYAKKGSTISLIAGCATGAVYAGCVVAYTRDANSAAATLTALIVSLLLTGMMGSRYYKTGARVPKIVTCLSLAASIVFGLNYIM